MRQKEKKLNLRQALRFAIMPSLQGWFSDAHGARQRLPL
jgi:hypothetical protein